MSSPCTSCPDGTSDGTLTEVVAYRLFISHGKDYAITFATAFATPENRYNPCLIPFAIAFLQNPSAWHEAYGR
jgi:hypothetical protein